MAKDKQPDNPTEEITIRTIYFQIGKLTSAVESLEDQVENLSMKVYNPKCIKETELENIAEVARSNTKSIGKLDGLANRAIGGKMMFVYLIALLISVAGIVTAAVMNYKTNEKVKIIEKRVNGAEKTTKALENE